MNPRILLLTSHSIAEHDDLDMFSRMGLDVFSIGAYTNPWQPGDDKRPALPNAPYYPALEQATNDQRHRMTVLHGDPGPNIDWAKARLAPEVIDWADIIIVHHFPEQWIGGNWAQIRDKRVIWRTCGQSDPRLEAAMGAYTDDGLQVVRYSPKEREAFTRWGAFAGEDALIRFGKDPDEWTGWNGHGAWVGNITQHMKQRGDACGYGFWEEATRNLEVRPAGPGSKELRSGIGELSYEDMRHYLRQIRVYLYTGTRPASYTLGLIEAMMTGTPVVAMPGSQFWPSELYEADEITGYAASRSDHDPVAATHAMLKHALNGDWSATSRAMRQRAIDLFGLAKISAEWAQFLDLDAEEMAA